MRALLTSILLTAFSTTTSSEYSPFYETYRQRSSVSYNGLVLDLFRREGNCGSGVSCATMGDEGSCCKSDTRCAVDMAGHVACCPENAQCTGTIGAGAVIATATGLPTTVSGASPTITSGAGSIVPNGFFPFPYLPTTYPNAAVCSSSFSSCQTEFQRCTSQLIAGDNGLTISGIGPGITREAALPSTSAASICSSLSVEACYNLQLTNCPMYGTAAGSGGTFEAAGAAPTLCAGVYGVGMGVGMAIGFAGQLVA